MRGFKLISFVAAFIYLSSMILVNSQVFNYTSIASNKLLIYQLNDAEKINFNQKILIYGSSGVLYGLSAKDIQVRTGYSTFNLSTVGQGGQMEKFIEIISKSNNYNSIVILSDRNYRNNNYNVATAHEYLNLIRKLSLVVNVRQLKKNPLNRDAVGDMVDYPNSNPDFNIGKRDKYPRYSNENINLMRNHINSLISVGVCPIVAYVPLLVKSNEVENYINATAELNSAVIESGIENYVAFTPMIEVQKSYFVNDDHMSALGRDKWSRLLLDEITKRHMCGIKVKETMQ